MNKTINKIVAGFSVGLLTVGGVLLNSSAAQAAPPPPVAPKQIMGGFAGQPDAGNLNTGQSFTIVNLVPEEPYTVSVDYAEAGTPGSFNPYLNIPVTGTAGVAPAGNTVNVVIQDVLTTPTLETGDVLRFSVTSNVDVSAVFTYLIPETGNVDGQKPLVTFTETNVSPQQAVTGTPVTISNLDLNKDIQVETIVATPAGGGSFDNTVIKREYFAPGSYPEGSLDYVAYGFSPTDTTTPLPDGSFVIVSVSAGSGLGSNNSSTGNVVLQTPVLPEPVGTFTPANPSLQQLASGVTYTVENVDPTLEFNYLIFERAEEGTNTWVEFDGREILPANVTDNTYIVNNLTLTLPAGQVLRASLVTPEGIQILNEYIPANNAPILTPSGSFTVGSPSVEQLKQGTEFTIEGIANSDTNIVSVFVAPAADPTGFIQANSFTIDPVNIVNNRTSFTVTLPNIAAGDVVSVRLSVNNATAVNLQNYVTPAIPTPPIVEDPVGEFINGTPSGLALLLGVDYRISNLDDTKNNVMSLFIGDEEAVTLTIPNTDIVDGETIIKLHAYEELENGKRRELANGTQVRVELAVDEGTPFVLSDFKITSTNTSTPTNNNTNNNGQKDRGELVVAGADATPLLFGGLAFLVLGGTALFFVNRRKKPVEVKVTE